MGYQRNNNQHPCFCKIVGLITTPFSTFKKKKSQETKKTPPNKEKKTHKKPPNKQQDFKLSCNIGDGIQEVLTPSVLIIETYTR